MDIASLISLSELTALGTVILTDLALAGDNAIVVGMAAASLPAEQRRKAIFVGILAATIMRILFALVTTQLLQIVGLLLAGGILLAWVSWKLWREIREQGQQDEGEAVVEGKAIPEHAPKSFKAAITQIVVADISMSLDNVLAVAGAAREHAWVLIFGLGLSVVLMGVASSFVARLLTRHRWIAYVGLFVILYIALRMMWDGSMEVMAAVASV
ncbi:MAG: TerC family protein [Gammaproteobacteria bacterium]|nr:TerC family protein [Gammaproteobacteria bacterium]